MSFDKMLNKAVKRKNTNGKKVLTKKERGNKDIKIKGEKNRFGTDNQPTAEQKKKGYEKRKEKTKKRRDLLDLLNMSLKGDIGEAVQAKFKDGYGKTPRDIQEALHMVMITKVITKNDVYAYQALMTASGLNKPIKVDTTTNGESLNKPMFDYSKFSTEDLMKLKELNDKYSTKNDG